MSEPAVVRGPQDRHSTESCHLSALGEMPAGTDRIGAALLWEETS